MRNRWKKLALTSATAAVLCFFSASAFAENCGDAQGLSEFIKKPELQKACPPGKSSCSADVGKISDSAKKYDDMVKKTCGQIEQRVGKIVNISQGGEKELQQNMSSAKSQVDEIIAANDKIRGEVAKAMEPGINSAETLNNSSKLSRSTQQWQDDERAVKLVKNAHKSKTLESAEFDRKKVSGVSDADVKSSLFAPAIGTEIIKILAEDKKKREDLALKLQNAADGAQTRADNRESAPDTKEKKSGGLMDSLMNPSTLLGLATAGAGLLAAQKKNSDVSTPADATPPAPAPIVPIAAADLSGNKDNTGASQKLKLSNDEKKPDLASSAPFFGGGGGGYKPLDSGISYKANSATGSVASTPVSAGGGGLGGLSGGSGESSSAHREPGSAALPQKTDDSLGGGFSGGGGGGGLNFGGATSPSAAPAEAKAEDPLRDTLHDAIAAGETPATDPNADSSQAALGQIDGESEMLFTRVKSCIQRSVKRGLVISGLTAKIR